MQISSFVSSEASRRQKLMLNKMINVLVTRIISLRTRTVCLSKNKWQYYSRLLEAP